MKRTFYESLEKRGDRQGEDRHPFDPERGYKEYVDGKPRYDGVASSLDPRHISLPCGAADHPPE